MMPYEYQTWWNERHVNTSPTLAIAKRAVLMPENAGEEFKFVRVKIAGASNRKTEVETTLTVVKHPPPAN